MPQVEGVDFIQNNSVSSDSHLEIGHAVVWSGLLDGLNIVTFQFQGQFILISLRPVLGIVAAWVC